MACRTRKRGRRGRRYRDRRIETPAGLVSHGGRIRYLADVEHLQNNDALTLWQVRPQIEVKKLNNTFTNEQAATFAQRNAAKLSPCEADFIRDVLRYRWRGPSLSLSKKQGAWVQRIAARIHDEDIGDLVEVERVEGWV